MIHVPTIVLLLLAVAAVAAGCGVNSYRNRPDRRKVPGQIPAALAGPIMTFTAESAAEGHLTITFSENLISFDPTDAQVLNSMRIWIPTAEFEGTAQAMVWNGLNVIDVEFGTTPGVGDFAGVWVFDQWSFFRGLNTGARCTGNPVVFEGN